MITKIEIHDILIEEGRKIEFVDKTEYPLEEKLQYKDSASIYIVLKNSSVKSTILLGPEFDEHNEELESNESDQKIIVSKSFEIDRPDDGYITFYHMVFPKSSENIKVGEYFYENEKIYYKKSANESIEKSILELIEVNKDSVNFYIFRDDFFLVYNLRRCYINLCQKIFNDRGFDRCFNGKVSSSLIFRRDLIWAALNTIEYLTYLNRYVEAQRLLERITGCNGLCPQSEYGGTPNCGCNE